MSPARVFRILAVDDEEAILSLYRDILCLEEPDALHALFAGEGDPERESPATAFDLTPCSDGDQAVRAVQAALSEKRPYSVALVDVRMTSGPDGVSTAERIRRFDPQVEIVMVTAHTDISLRELNRRVPPPEKLLYVQKPFRPMELRQLATSLCAKWNTEHRLKEINENLAQLVEARTRELAEANRRMEKDLDERMLMLREVWASEERYRMLFEKDVTGNFVAGEDGRVMACNESFARIFGFAGRDQAMGFNVLSLDVEGGTERSLGELIRSRSKVDNFEAALRRKGLPPVHVIGNFIGVFDEGGRLSEVRGYFFDITERKRLEEQLRLAQKMEALGTLAGGIAHDFNNILGVIMGYAELIRDGADPGSGLARRVQEILGAGSRARDLVNQILNFSRQGPQELKPVRISPLLKETVKLIRASLPPGVEVRVHIQAEEDLVAADPTQVHQIILNLCANAGHAMRETGGVLEVSLTEVRVDAEGAASHPGLSEGNFLRLTVSDSGHGMSQDILERIFDPFFTTKKPGEGTGMGLSVVHGIVRRHNGAVLVQSEEGRGSAFHVFLPRTDQAEETSEEVAPQVMPRPARVLFVDDEKALADIGREMLESLGLTVAARTSSVEALEAFRSRPGSFDLVVTDQSMPNMTGLELAKEVLSLRPGTPILLCTGFSEAVSLERIRGLGVKGLLMKPLLKRQLASAVAEILNAGAQEGERAEG